MPDTTTKNKFALIAVIFLLLIELSSSAQIIRYVDSTKADIGQGGTSWATASNNFQATLNASMPGDQVWVRKGTYMPESGLPFSMRQGIAIYGGFVGTETALNQRNYITNKTILKGNGNRVIYNYSPSINNTAIIDGFTITGGTNSGDGGGMYNFSSSPTISNCTFSNNYSSGGDGGAMYNYSSSPIITNCIFNNNSVNNSSGFSGGAMRNEFAGSSPIISNCTFSNNTAISGNGGAISNEDATPNITNSTFNNNNGRYGAAIANNGSSALLNISNCIFKSNSAATGAGGGIYNIFGASPTINNCMFSYNTATTGGGMYNYQASPTINNCIFNNNIANAGNSFGGGMYNANVTTSLTISNCVFSYNSVSGVLSYGAGMYNTTSSPTIRNSIFSNNTATYTGTGGAYGSGMCNSSSSPNISNTTFSNNAVTGIYGYGGGMYNHNSSSPTITNSILYGDTGGEIYNSTATPVVTYSDVQGGYSGIGNINTNPLFVNPVNPIGSDSIWGTTDDGLKLLVCGPPINVGSNAAVSISNTTDITGASRIQQGIVDMGAYEGGEVKTITWLGFTDNWSTTSNWSGGYKPDACNHVIY